MGGQHVTGVGRLTILVGIEHIIIGVSKGKVVCDRRCLAALETALRLGAG